MNRVINNNIKCLILVLISVVFLMIFSFNTSPLTSWHGSDSSFFILVGEGMTEGMLPYRDFFDMKGPYLFEIEHIGQMIANGKTGAFIIQCLNLFFCLVIIDKIFHLDKKDISWKNWLTDMILFTLPCLILASYFFEGGNLTEEYSLPLLLIALLLCIDYIRKNETYSEKGHPIIYGGYYGCAFGILVFIRITNAALIGAILVTIALDLFFHKKYRNLVWNGIAFVTGCIIAIAPACIYYAKQGLLNEMLNQVFIFGVQYSSGKNTIDKVYYLLEEYGNILITMTFPIITLALFKVKKWKYWVLSIASYAMLLIAFLLGNIYTHYFTLAIPHMVLGFVFLVEQKDFFKNEHRIKQMAVITVVVVLFGLMYRNIASSTWRCLEKIFAQENTSANVLEIMEMIPEDDYDDVYVYNVGSCSRWCMQAGILPIYKYCDWQNTYIRLNPEIGYELSSWIEEDGPKWIVTTSDGAVEPQIIANIVKKKYTVHFENDSYVLYFQNEEK